MTTDCTIALHHVLARTARTPDTRPAPGTYRVDVALDGRISGQYCRHSIAGNLHVGPRGGIRWEPDTVPKHPRRKRH